MQYGPFPIFAEHRLEGNLVEDNYRHKGLRRKLVKELGEKGIEAPEVLDAIGEVPRHCFLDDAFLEYAYQDRAFPIDAGQTISQPYTVARQSSLLRVEKGMRVLEIGTGSGYQAAVLAAMKARVITLERQKSLYDQAKWVLRKLGYRVRCFFGDGYQGAPSFAPFDRILVTCGAPSFPHTLAEQLAPGGILVVPLGEEEQRMKRFIKNGDGSFEESDHGRYRFVPMLDRRAKNGGRV